MVHGVARLMFDHVFGVLNPVLTDFFQQSEPVVLGVWGHGKGKVMMECFSYCFLFYIKFCNK